MGYLRKILNKLSALRLQNKVFFTYSLVFLLMFAVIFGIANLLIERAFEDQLDKDLFELRSNISTLYALFVNSIKDEVKAMGENRDIRNALRRAERGGGREIPQTNFDVFECGNTAGILVLSKRGDDPRIGHKDPDVGDVKSDETLKNGKGTIRERIIEKGEDPQLIVEVTQWMEWGFITGGRSLRKWLEGTMFYQPAEHPIFLVKKTDELEEWIPLNNSAGEKTALRDEWQLQMQAALAQGKPVEGLVVALKDSTPENGHELSNNNSSTPKFTVVRTDILSTPFSDSQRLPFVELIIAYSHENRIQWLDQMRVILLLSVGGGAVLVYCISYLVSRRITRPISQLQKGVSEIGAGNLNYQISVQTKGEVGELANEFNQMALALRKSLEEHKAAERIAVWRDVARQLAHEVKNPLFPIRLSVENLQEAKDRPDIFDEIFNVCTETIIEEVDRIRVLIDEFHQYARLPVPDRHSVNLNDVVNSVLKLYVELSQAQEIKVEKELSPLPELSLDREQMERAIGNLVKNAIEAMPEGGTLTLRTHSTSETPSSENRNDNLTAENGRYISLEVQDTGYGMSEETQLNLFAPDYTTKTYGTGLGMAIVRRIITVHGGELTVESEENVGTTIRVSFNESTYLNDHTPVIIPGLRETTNDVSTQQKVI
ncbi:HAMP domain-containing protein [Candidatus Poribacteria bacterium]|nr:HAMP domain-containing protein [Candidatus Poribacteria bacterium]